MAKIKRKVRRAQPPVIAEPSVAPEAAAATGEAPAEAPRTGATRGQFQDPDAVLKADGIPWFVWREWWRAVDRGDFDFVFALSGEGSNLREHFGAREEFPEVCRRKLRQVNGIRESELLRIRLEGPDEAFFISANGYTARERRDYELERWHLRRQAKGWRVLQIDVLTLPKTRAPKDVPLSEFPVVAPLA